MHLSRIAGLAVGLAVLTTGCDDESPGVFQPNVVNETETFSIQAGALRDVTATETYAWANPGVTANVNQSGVLTAGGATLTVTDADNVTVYTSDLENTGTFETSVGVSGLWTVRLDLVGVTGDIDFSLQTP